MKNLMKMVLLMALTLSVSMVSAQKSGRINVQAVIMAMPETTKMQSDLETIRQDYSANLETMQVELNNKYVDFQQNSSTMTETIRAMKQKEIQDLGTRMEQFEANAMQEIQAKQQELLQPIITKARDAVAAEAKAKGCAVVYDESAGALAYFDETVVTDLTPAVKTRLGIK
ncbi:MAG: OmpH family outer membrane protein [Rikenellaceae bacterium]